jgi:hypothetical protein
MAMSPDSSFPLLASDQAEVIRIFLELMDEHDRTEHPSELMVNRPRGLGKASDGSPFAGPPDLE